MVKNPFDLGAGKIGVRNQAGRLPDVVGKTLLDQPIDDISRTAALPYDCVVNRATGFALPQDSGLPLVGNADARDTVRGDTGGGQHFQHGRVLGRPDFDRILLDPAFPGILLRQFVLPD